MVFFVQLCGTIRIHTIKWIVGTKCFVTVRFDIAGFLSSESEILFIIIIIITIINSVAKNNTGELVNNVLKYRKILKSENWKG